METEALEELGLTKNESIVYITLLYLGKSNIGQIAEKTRMHRKTIYDCLKRLEDRGLISFVVEGKTKFFTATNPQKLREIIKEKEAKIENILPKLFQFTKKPKEKIEVTIHRGKESLKNIMEDIIKTKPEIWHSLTSSTGKSIEILPYFISQFHRRRIKLGIKLEIIFDKNKKAIKRARELKRLELTEIKFIDTKYVFPLSLWIYNNKIAFMLWESETGILIENKETADSFKNYFKIIWKAAFNSF